MAAIKLSLITILVSLGSIHAAPWGFGLPSLPLPVQIPDVTKSVPKVPGVPDVSKVASKVPGVPATTPKAPASSGGGGGGLFGMGLPSLPGMGSLPGLDAVTNPASLVDPTKVLGVASKMTDVLPGPLKQMLPGPLNPDNLKGLEVFAGAVDKKTLQKFLNPLEMAQLVSSGAIRPDQAVKLVKILTSGKPDIVGLMELGANNKMIDQLLVAPVVSAGGFMIGKGLADGSLFKMIGSASSLMSFFG